MNGKRTYTKEEAAQVVSDLIEVVSKRMRFCEDPENFIREHPWTEKYLGNVAEAEDLLSKVRTGLIKIVDLTKSLQKIYRKDTLILFVTAPIGREIVFRFEKQEDGFYAALNG